MGFIVVRLRDLAVHVFVVGAVGAAAVTGVGLVQSVGAVGGGTASSFVPIVPCRLMDTRAAAQVGTRNTPMGPAETATFAVWGSNGSCTIPNTATGIATNVTALGATSPTYLTLYPADSAQPPTSNLNPAPGQPPTPNQVTVGLSTGGAIKMFNERGTVDVIIDIVGYYIPATANVTPSADPARVVWVATSGVKTFPSVTAALASITDNDATHQYVIKVAPGTYTEAAGIVMKDYVDIEGSGVSTTTITATSAAATSTTITATGSLHAELRDLTVTNTGGGVDAFPLRIINVPTGSSLQISDVRASGSGAPNNWGVVVSGSAPAITNVVATATGGVFAYAISLGSASPIMTNVTSTATGASNSSRGINMGSSSSPKMVNVTTAASGSGAYGVYSDSSALSMTGGFAGSAGNDSRGIYLVNGGSATLVGITVTSSGTFSSGVDNFGGTVEIRNSAISSWYYAVKMNLGSTKVADTELTNGTNGGVVCFNAFTPAFVAATCG